MADREDIFEDVLFLEERLVPKKVYCLESVEYNIKSCSPLFFISDATKTDTKKATKWGFKMAFGKVAFWACRKGERLALRCV